MLMQIAMQFILSAWRNIYYNIFRALAAALAKRKVLWQSGGPSFEKKLGPELIVKI